MKRKYIAAKQNGSIQTHSVAKANGTHRFTNYRTGESKIDPCLRFSDDIEDAIRQYKEDHGIDPDVVYELVPRKFKLILAEEVK